MFSSPLITALIDEVVNLIIHQDYASASFLQRKFKIGYARAARILDQLEAAGYVGPAEGSKPREVIKRSTEMVNSEIESKDEL